jgi:hypothetical protein
MERPEVGSVKADEFGCEGTGLIAIYPEIGVPAYDGDSRVPRDYVAAEQVGCLGFFVGA